MSVQPFHDSHDRREHERQDRDEILFLQITRCEANTRLEGTTVLCSTLDVSASGLRLNTEKPVEKGQEMDLWVNVDGRAGKFFLAGVVAWSHSENGKHSAGIQILEQENTDYRGWFDWFS